MSVELEGNKMNTEKKPLIIDGKQFEADGILFDVDGTIWDSTGVVTEAWNQALIDSGHGDIQVTADRLKGLFGLPMIDIIQNILPDENLEEQKRFETICYEYEENYIKAKAGKVYDGIDDAIKQLSNSYKIIIVSNCQSGYIELVIEHLKLQDYVIDHVCPGDSGLLKADNILLMSKKHGLKHPIYVGDTQMDADACRKAGVPMVFAAYGFGKVNECAAKINTPKELLDLF